MIVDKIKDYLTLSERTLDESIRYEVEKFAGAVFKRQFMTLREADTKGKLRLSNVGRCPRQQAYEYHGFDRKGKELDSRSSIIFWTGDLVELTVVNLAKLAGCNLLATGLQQMTIKLPVNGGFVEGHPDGILLQDKKTYLLEVKSMNSFGFKKFERGEIDPAYLFQVNAYMEALGLNSTVFVALSKDSGVLHEMVVEKDEKIVKQARKNILEVMHSTADKLPDPPEELAPDSKGTYPWNCLYCKFWGHCRPNAERILVRNAYKLREKDGTNKPANRPTAA